MVEVVDVVVVGVAGGAGDWLTRLPSVVPVSAPPKIVDSGLPEISSIAVMNSSARTKTMATVPAMARQEKPGGVRAGRALSRRCRRGLQALRGRSRRVAEISRRSVSADEAADDAISTVSARVAALRPRLPDHLRGGRRRVGVHRGRRRPARAGAPEPAQQASSLGSPDHDLLDDLVAPVDRLGHEGGAHGGRGRADGHADDRPLHPEDRRDRRQRRPRRRWRPGSGESRTSRMVCLVAHERFDGAGDELAGPRIEHPVVSETGDGPGKTGDQPQGPVPGRQ